jgi:uncharacterized protein YcbX
MTRYSCFICFVKALVKSIFIYPIKSMQGVSLSAVQLTPTGLKDDRKYMLIDSENKFVSQRSLSKLAQFQVHISGQELLVQRGIDQLSIKQDDFQKEQFIDVRIWDEECKAHQALESINSWFSNQLDKDVRLVEYVSGTRVREKKSPFETQFPDGYPVLVTNTRSLSFLNSQLKNPVPMERFRPNIVMDFQKEQIEFSSSILTAKNAILENRKPCERCQVITIDQKTGIRKDKEVLSKIVDTERKAAVFGINCTVGKAGRISLGDEFDLSS